MNLSFEGKVALVTVAGAGMGLATAKAFAEAGASVVLSDVYENSVRAAAEELTAAGYTILTKSNRAGVDLFVKQKQQSLFVHFQGHPEYGAQTLLKEYRRDIKRFLRSERETYPTMPYGYFASTQALIDFQKAAIADRREEIMASFPEAVVNSLLNSWHSVAVSIYAHWLKYLAAKATESAFIPVLTGPADERKRSAAS